MTIELNDKQVQTIIETLTHAYDYVELERRYYKDDREKLKNDVAELTRKLDFANGLIEAHEEDKR